MENITTEEVMDNLYMFWSRFGTYMNLAGGICSKSKLALVRRLPEGISKKVFLYVQYDLQ